ARASGLADAAVFGPWGGFPPLSLAGYPAIGPRRPEALSFLPGHGPPGIGPAPASVELLVALMLGEAPAVPPDLFDPRRFGRPPSLPAGQGSGPTSRGGAGPS